MTDFVAALNEGFDAAEKAERARREVDEVFRQLDDQIREGTKNRLSVTRSLLEVPRQETFFLGSTRVANPFVSKSREKYWAIVATNPSVPKAKALELARWYPPRKGGYPCKIWWAGEEHICEDKEGLANCLADLLRDPDVAATLMTVKNRQTVEGEISEVGTTDGSASGSSSDARQDIATDDVGEVPQS